MKHGTRASQAYMVARENSNKNAQPDQFTSYTAILYLILCQEFEIKQIATIGFCCPFIPSFVGRCLQHVK